MPGEINIDEVLKTRASIAIDPEETPQERAARLQRERWQTIFEMFRSYVLFFVVILGIVAIGIFCGYLSAFDPAASAETKRWAQTVLSALFTGTLSFVLGQMTAGRKST